MQLNVQFVPNTHVVVLYREATGIHAVNVYV
jgi:hypothetical protein